MYKHREPKERPFAMFHCWALLQNNEKWKDRNNECLGRKKAQEDGDDEEAQEVADMATPKNVKKRPPRRRGEKDKEVDASIFKMAIEGIIETKKELEAVKTQENESRWLEVKAMEERKVVIQEKLTVLAEEVNTKKMEQELKILFMSTDGLDANQKAYLSMMKQNIIAGRGLGGTSGN